MRIVSVPIKQVHGMLKYISRIICNDTAKNIKSLPEDPPEAKTGESIEIHLYDKPVSSQRKKLNWQAIATIVLGFLGLWIPSKINQQTMQNTQISKMAEFIPKFYDKMHEIDSLRGKPTVCQSGPDSISNLQSRAKVHQSRAEINPYVDVLSTFGEYSIPVLTNALRYGVLEDDSDIILETKVTLERLGQTATHQIVNELRFNVNLISCQMNSKSVDYIAALSEVVFEMAKEMHREFNTPFLSIFRKHEICEWVRPYFDAVSSNLSCDPKTILYSRVTKEAIMLLSLTNVPLRSFKLLNLHVSNEPFDAVDFSGANLSGSTFEKCEFRGCKFSKTILTNVDFSNSHFYGRNLNDSLGIRELTKAKGIDTSSLTGNVRRLFIVFKKGMNN